MTRHYRRLPAAIEKEALAALLERGLTRAFVTLAYAKWKQHQPAERCRFGREQIIAVDCDCLGCNETLAMLYFDQVQKQFAMLPQ